MIYPKQYVEYLFFFKKYIRQYNSVIYLLDETNYHTIIMRKEYYYTCQLSLAHVKTKQGKSENEEIAK